MFAQSAQLTRDYATYMLSEKTPEACAAIESAARVVIAGCIAEIGELHNGSVHGARQHSRAELLSKWKDFASLALTNARIEKAALIQ